MMALEIHGRTLKKQLTGFAVSTLLFLQGCATVSAGTGQTVTVVTQKGIEGASCKLTDQVGSVWHVSATPGTVTVNKGDGPMSVVCSKPGYRDGSVLVDEDVAGATYGNILVGGVIGVAVDAASGAAQRYPDVIEVWMEPAHWESLEARIEWLMQKRASLQKKPPEATD